MLYVSKVYVLEGVFEWHACETNPIPNGRDAPLFHYSIIPVFQAQALRAKQSQLPLRCRSGDGCSRGPIVGNKANWPGWAGRDTARRGRDGPIVQNKPNSPGRPSPMSHHSIVPAFQFDADRAKQSQLARMERKRHGQARPGRTDCAKQTQFSEGAGS